MVEMSAKLTIEEVIDLKTGEVMKADWLFNQQEGTVWRERIAQERDRIKGSSRWVCPYCNDPVKIRGGKSVGKNLIAPRRLHFAHQKNSPDCPIKTGQNYSRREIERMKWNGQKESEAHKRIKNIIANSLETDSSFSTVEIERRISSRNDRNKWRKPDVSAIGPGGRRFVFEIQLSTTFLEVILAREEFYKREQTFLCWIFDKFSTLPNEQKFTDKDILYSNNCNVFVANDETLKKSLLHGELTFECHYLEPVRSKTLRDPIELVWRSETVRFSELTVDNTHFRLFYFDHERRMEEIKCAINKELEEEKKLTDIKRDIDDIIHRHQEGHERIDQLDPKKNETTDDKSVLNTRSQDEWDRLWASYLKR
jgi:competence CoiA-like predicted nuclease